VILADPVVDPAALEQRTGWSIKPEGACKGGLCVPLPPESVVTGGLDARLLAARLGMPVVEEPDRGLLALGPESLTGRALTTAEAPDLVLPDLDGRPFALSSLRGTRVVLVAWASWCGCRTELVSWAALREELRPQGIEIVTVALDAEPEAARPWIELAAGNHPALIDRNHVMGELFGVVNVPSSVWIDEDGLIVRPSETCYVVPPAGTEPPPRPTVPAPDAEVPADLAELMAVVSQLPRNPEAYTAALRDWAANGRESRFAHTPEEVVARSRARSPERAEAAAHFELGEHLREIGDIEAAQHHWREAHRLEPDNWTYKRQAWELVAPGPYIAQLPSDVYAGSWLEDVKTMGPGSYYQEWTP
jgi:peroxiredoxin